MSKSGLLVSPHTSTIKPFCLIRTLKKTVISDCFYASLSITLFYFAKSKINVVPKTSTSITTNKNAKVIPSSFGSMGIVSALNNLVGKLFDVELIFSRVYIFSPALPLALGSYEKLHTLEKILSHQRLFLYKSLWI